MSMVTDTNKSKVLAQAVIDVALSEVGYLEKKSNANLDDKTANAGDKNYTKYGRDLVRWIGSPYANGVAWCDMFCDWCFIKAFGKIKAMELLNGWSAYTPTSAQYFKNIGRWFPKNPKAGDLVFFKNATRIHHVGLVYKVDAARIYTVEGNTASQGSDVVVANGGGVFKKSYALTNPNIAGYGRPQYTEECECDIDVVSFDKPQYKYGIDISEFQGKIDFAQVKKSNVEFAFLRSTKKDGSVDKMFETFYEGCKKNGIDIGVYKYSYAKSEVEAIAEADGVIKLLNGRKHTIWYDLENANQLCVIGNSGIDKVAKAFLKRCKEHGYEVGIYCNLDWYKNHMSADLKREYKFWLARYGKNNGALNDIYKPNLGEVGWQYTSVGKVSGIVGDVDLDVFYA